MPVLQYHSGHLGFGSRLGQQHTTGHPGHLPVRPRVEITPSDHSTLTMRQQSVICYVKFHHRPSCMCRGSSMRFSVESPEPCTVPDLLTGKTVLKSRCQHSIGKVSCAEAAGNS